MPRAVKRAAKRASRVTINVQAEVRRQIGLAAARRNVSIRKYLLGAIEERVREDLSGSENFLSMTAQADPVLAELWNNPRDARYDKL